MFDSAEYQLLDFGNGQKLERFGDVCVSRQSPSIPVDASLAGDAKKPADLSYVRKASGAGHWLGDDQLRWQVKHGTKIFELRATPSGQVGIFPEQAVNWQWIEDSSSALQGLNALNLFGYTGGTTMALAHAGARVTHVDAAKGVVKWARQNAAQSGLRDHPIRWVAEDAVRFVEREIRRGNTYEIVVADPPSFGRGPAGESWKLENDLADLLSSLGKLVKRPELILLSCHTPSFDCRRLSSMIADAWPGIANGLREVEMHLKTADDRRLASGHAVQWRR